MNAAGISVGPRRLANRANRRLACGEAAEERTGRHAAAHRQTYRAAEAQIAQRKWAGFTCRHSSTDSPGSAWFNSAVIQRMHSMKANADAPESSDDAQL